MVNFQTSAINKHTSLSYVSMAYS